MALVRRPLCSSLGLVTLLACTPKGAPDDESSSADLSEESSATSGSEADADDGPQLVCVPDETRCADDHTLERCTATGLTWEAEPCETHQTCEPCYGSDGNPDDCVAACIGPCERLQDDQPSSLGCSFFATSMYQAASALEEPPPDALVVGNPDPDRAATIELRFVPEGSNQEVQASDPVLLDPGETHVFVLDPELTIYDGDGSLYRSGVIHHVISDLPIVAYLHSPFEGSSTNGAALLLPEHMMQPDYVVYGYPAYVTPSYFSIIALQDQTVVRWQPRVETAGNGLPLPFVEAGAMGEQLLNRFDNLRIDSSVKYDRPPCEQDLSGTVVTADKPIWLVSAVRGIRVPFCASENTVIPGCAPPAPMLEVCERGSDFVQEQNLPLAYWGEEYVAPHSPLRADEDHYWRVFAGADNVTIHVEPAQPGTPIVLAQRGDFSDLVVPAGTDLVFRGDGPFMPVQYVAGHYEANNIGSPAMVQMVPTEQFIDSYAFVTGFNYDFHYVQVIRPGGGAEVLLDGITVGGWEPVGDWDVVTVEIAEGAHFIRSEEAFGIVQYGYTAFTDELFSSGYAYPGGMRAEVLFIP